MSKLSQVAAALALAMAAAGSASAAEVTIYYTGLDLTRTEQAAEFKARVMRAADHLCNDGSLETRLGAGRAACREAVWAEAKAKLSQGRRLALETTLHEGAPTLANPTLANPTLANPTPASQTLASR